MTVSTVNTRRLDPYRNFKFRLLWGASRTPVAGFSKAAPLKRSAARVATEKGGRRRLSLAPVTLERGITHDRGFVRWMSKHPRKAGAPAAPRRDIRIEVRGTAGRPTRRYALSGCRISAARKRLTAAPAAAGVLIDRLRLDHEGCRQVLPRRQRI